MLEFETSDSLQFMPLKFRNLKALLFIIMGLFIKSQNASKISFYMFIITFYLICDFYS